MSATAERFQVKAHADIWFVFDEKADLYAPAKDFEEANAIVGMLGDAPIRAEKLKWIDKKEMRGRQ